MLLGLLACCAAALLDCEPLPLISTNIETSAASSFLFGQLHGRRCPPRTGRARGRRRWPRLARLDDRRWPDDHAPLLRQAHPPPPVLLPFAPFGSQLGLSLSAPASSAARRLILERPDAPGALCRPRGTLLLLSVQSAAASFVRAVPKCTAGPSVGRPAAVRRAQTHVHRPSRPPPRLRCRRCGSRPAVLPRLALLLPLLLLPAQAAALLLGPLVTLVV